MIRAGVALVTLVVALTASHGCGGTAKPTPKPKVTSKFSGKPCYKKGLFAHDKTGDYQCERKGDRYVWKKIHLKEEPPTPERG